MKKTKHRLAVSILTIIAMVVTLIPAMGGAEAAADTSGSILQKKTATRENPVKEVIYTYQNDGTYYVSIVADLSVYTSEELKTATSWGAASYSLNGGRCLGLLGGPYDFSKGGVFTQEISGERNNRVKPGEEFWIKFELCDDPFGDEPVSWVSFSKAEFTAPAAPVQKTEVFKGMKAEPDILSDGSFNGFNVSFESYEGSCNASFHDNVFYREELGTGELVCIDANHNSNNAVIGTDKPGYLECMGKTFAYYVIKKCVLDEQLPVLSVSQGKKVHIDGSIRNKLKFFGGYAEAKAPDPDFAAIDSLKITTGVRKANLSWTITDDPSTIDGYEIEQYYGSTKKQTYNVSAKSQYSRSGSKSVSIPYSGTSKFRIRTYVKHYNGMSYQSPWSDMESCTSAKLKPSVGSVTKISSKKVRLTVTKAEGSTGTVIYQLVGKKWKKLGTTTGKSYTTTKNTAGKRKYKYKSYLKESGKTYYSSSYSKTYSPKSNVMNYSYSGSPASYKAYSHYWRPVKVYYSGNKVKVKCRFINTHIYRMDYCVVKVKIKCQGKVIGTKTINSGKISPKSTKTMTVTLDKSKSGYDLRNGGTDWYYSVSKWR